MANEKDRQTRVPAQEPVGDGLRLDRRRFLQATAAGVAAAALPAASGCGDDDAGPVGEPNRRPMDFDPETVSEDDVVFNYTIQSGAVTQTSALLLTYAEGSPPLTAVVWREDEDEGRIEVARAEGTPTDGFLKLPVDGLAPGRHYRYAFFHAGADGAFDFRSPIGRFRSAIAEDSLEPVTIACATCTGYLETMRPYNTLSLMARRPEVDFLVHLGDIAYCDAASRIRGYEGQTPEADPDGSLTRQAYRDIWRLHLEDPGYREILSQKSWYMTWDDHEVDDNWDPETGDPIVLREAFAAFDENVATPRDLDGGRLWRSYRWGRTLELFVLDSRSERKPSTRRTDNPIYLSEEQMRWFKEGLRDSPCHFKVVLNSVPMAKMPIPPWAIEDDRWDGYDAQIVDGGCDPVGDAACFDDPRWEGAGNPRKEILDWIDEHDIPNVYFISGDFHVGFVAYIAPNRSGRAGRTLDIAVGPSGNINPLGIGVENGIMRQELVFPSPQFLYYQGTPQATTVLRFDPASNSVRVEFEDGHPDRLGEVLHDRVYNQEDL